MTNVDQAQPGWRGVDADNNLWTRVTTRDAERWLVVSPLGRWRYADDTEALAANPRELPAGKPLDPNNADDRAAAYRLAAVWLRNNTELSSAPASELLLEASRLDAEAAAAAQDQADRELADAHQFDPSGRICSCGVLCGVVCDGLTYPQHLVRAVRAADARRAEGSGS